MRFCRANKAVVHASAPVSVLLMCVLVLAAMASPPRARAQPLWDCRPDEQGLGWDCRTLGGLPEPATAVSAPPPVREEVPRPVEAVPADQEKVEPAGTPSDTLADEAAPRPRRALPPTAPPAVEVPAPAEQEGERVEARSAGEPARIESGSVPEPAPPLEAPEVEEKAPEAFRAMAPDVPPTEVPAGPARDDLWLTCRTGTRPSTERLPPGPYRERDLAVMQLASNVVTSEEGQRTVFVGDVDVRRADQRLTADRVTYNETDNTLQAEGNIQYTDTAFDIKGSEAEFDLDTDQGSIRNVEYSLYPRHGRGEAEQVKIESKTQSRFKELSYTTCDRDDLDWELRAKKLSLDTQEGVGTARHARLSFMHVPFLYLPYVTFPIDDRRKSGFLVPSIGQTDETGFDVSVPYYWNIAPNQDATFHPRHMSRRGPMLGADYRYLFAHNQGELKAELVPYDKAFDGTRGALSYTHSGWLAPRLGALVTGKYVSDDTYLEELGTDLVDSSSRILERRGELTYFGDFWSLLGRLQYYQTIDPTIAPGGRPYQRMPQLLFNLELPDRFAGLTYGFEAGLDKFERNDSVTGTRYNLSPALTLPLNTASTFLIPRATLHQRGYSLDNVPLGRPENPTRTIPTLSIDGGVLFERETGWDEGMVVQTLEPRLFYLYVPRENQDELPNFDSAELDFSFWQLFRENRFSGVDRIGDANQLSWALTSRMIHRGNGTELLGASIGEILYFANRQVTVPGEPPDTSSTSGLVGEVQTALGNWRAGTGTRWNVHNGQTDRSFATMQYRRDGRRVVNLSWRRRRQELNQTHFSLAWPIGRRWEVVGRWLYSLRENRSLDAFGGFEYESCCWIFRTLVREFVNTVGGQRNRVYMAQLELKGLSRFGNKVADALERDIVGFEARHASR
jgi:LPS-assembly protein